MSNFPPDHTSDYSDHEGDSSPVPPSRASLIPSEPKPQFGCGCVIGVPLFFFITPLVGFFKPPLYWTVLSGIPLIGLITAIGLMATKKYRWFGVGLFAGFLLFALFYGLILWIVISTLSEN